MSLTVDKSLHWVFSAPWHDTNLKLVLNWLIVPLNWSVYLIFIYELDIDRQPKWLKMDNLEENLSYASFNSARYLILKISCWNSENCKGRTISKSIIYVTSNLLQMVLLFTVQIWSPQKSMHISMGKVHVGASERSCYFLLENVLEHSELPVWRYQI